jgi:glycosyltransferase involved in cell wall biosynthesis
MPYSYPHYKNNIREHFEKYVPISNKILDVGPGAGTYSELLRNLGYKMDCLEIFEPYVHQFGLKSKYDNVIVGDITNFDFSKYDYIIMGDVLEHLTVEDAKSFMDKVTSLDKKCLVAVPYNYEQGEHYGNVYETHLQPDLTPQNVLERYPKLNLLVGDNSYGYYINYYLNKPGITWLAKFDDYASMGILSQKILEQVKDHDVSCKPIIGETQTKNQLIHQFINKPTNHDIGIMFSYPDMVGYLKEFKVKVVYTGTDTTKGYVRFVQKSKEVDYILTPSKLSKRRLELMGVNTPIFVFPHGIDENDFQYQPRKKSDKFKFLYVGECSDRKGTFHLLRAFVELFKNNPNVELHMKSNNAMFYYGGEQVKQIVDQNSNIFWEISDEGHEKTIQLYNECHVYLYPSRADTFGMTVLEAMAVGLPVISTSEPGSTELVRGKYFEIPTKDVPVLNHPWLLGEWGEPNLDILKSHMLNVYENYNEVCGEDKLKEISDFVRTNYSWEEITKDFEKNILPKLKKDVRVLTLVTSYNRPHHISNLIDSLKNNKEKGYINDIYIVENSDTNVKEEAVRVIKEKMDDTMKLYVSEFNMGQRGSLLQLFEEYNLDDYDYIQFTDQDNLLLEPLSTYCDILNENPDIYFATGYMSKEHAELGWRKSRFGNLCEKRALRAGHMVLRVSDLKSMLPIHLDAHYGQHYASAWYAGLDWELVYWSHKSLGNRTDGNFVLCVPGGVIHKGVDSTMYDWPVEENEYPLDELKKMR